MGLGILIGLFIGIMLGFTACALLSANKEVDQEIYFIDYSETDDNDYEEKGDNNAEI